MVALHLRFPDPPDLKKSAGDVQVFIDLARRLDASGLLKGDWDPSLHPRWPTGSPDSAGGRSHLAIRRGAAAGLRGRGTLEPNPGLTWHKPRLPYRRRAHFRRHSIFQRLALPIFPYRPRSRPRQSLGRVSCRVRSSRTLIQTVQIA